MTNILVLNKNLKVLHLQIRAISDEVYGQNTHGFLQEASDRGRLHLNLRPGDILQPLQELKLYEGSWNYSVPSIPYVLTRKHCVLWKQCMDWSQLRRLEIGRKCRKTAFFDEFTGAIRNLESLKIGFDRAATRPPGWTIEPARRFIESIDALRHLIILNPGDQIDALWPAIRKHRRSLRSLVLPPLKHDPPYRENDLMRMRELREGIPELAHLELDIPMDSSFYKPLSTYIAILSDFSHLRTPGLCFSLPTDTSIFAPEYFQNYMGTQP